MAHTPGQQPRDTIFSMAWKWARATPLRTEITVVALIVLAFALAIGGYWWPGSGFDQFQGKADFQRAKTLWDWLGLLLVPAILAGGGILFSSADRKNEREIANERAKQDRERNEDTLRQALVQDYLDRMSELLLTKDLATSKADDLVREVARARTITVLKGLGEDGARKGYIVQFLYETGLINGDGPIIELKGADLQKADLSFVVMRRAALGGVLLSEANLYGADLYGANLTTTRLVNANLCRANLYRANLYRADLYGADFGRADLIQADLRWIDLRETNFRDADLGQADLTNAIITDEQLALVQSLEFTTMPDGTKYAGVPPTMSTSAPASPTNPTT